MSRLVYVSLYVYINGNIVCADRNEIHAAATTNYGSLLFNRTTEYNSTKYNLQMLMWFVKVNFYVTFVEPIITLCCVVVAISLYAVWCVFLFLLVVLCNSNNNSIVVMNVRQITNIYSKINKLLIGIYLPIIALLQT
ncbi:hypothetical protein PPL_09020 [Heterostelium album PN500]|uniref:Uncharacterized protein n=1 Tax=Heterostelium pallidum (strain ATCC 26659 / Pp 5 / PN500) TaxID=670386 RepID=D3BKD9_HETP5|nr:hypothetical protein PPL_09020 [Heterostelium album PN500]EFA78369.1 hypothetical protein PPL_09020 [Heterostelium album PN500]|eukprot:XP_020430494.1 hypothetical protein PPL_09020 [Heterostelium album PN500]